MIESLYDVRNRFVELMNSDEQLTEEQMRELNEDLCQELQVKSSNIIGYIMNSESLLAEIKNEENRLKAMGEKADKKFQKFKEYVKENMKALNVNQIPTKLGTLSIAKNPMSVEVVNEDEVPNEFKTQKTTVTTTINKTAIKEYFKETGEIPEGCIINTNKTTLRVK